VSAGADRRDRFEVVIVGCGIAGASIAHFLAGRGVSEILILEREVQPGYHATGRSAGVLARLDPIASVLGLKLLAAPFLREPPPGFTGRPLLEPSGILALLQGPLWQLAQRMAPGLEAAGVATELLSPSEVVQRIPVLNAGLFEGGVLLPEDGKIDVHELLWSYLRHARSRGAELRCGVEVVGVRVERGRCTAVATSGGEIRTRWVVNAAGAWAGGLGRLAGAAPIELVPMRRSVISFAAPPGIETRSWPLVSNNADPLYFAPESGGLYASPMDEVPCEPCDAQADDVGVALTIDRLERQAPRLVPRSLRRKWAGLRTFSPDRGLVVGEDPLVKGFFWLAGQGGCGIETSPVVGEIAAELLIDGKSERFDAASLAPERFASPGARSR
jgi:D-arginine dehydrogenase